MRPTPKTLRIATAMPAPFILSDYEPFVGTAGGAFGMTTLTDVTDTTVKDLRRTLAKAFAAGATVGYSGVPRIKAVFFDMDATVIVEESLVELAGFAGKGPEVAKLTESAMRGEIDFKQALIQRVAVLAGLSADILPQVAERLTLTRGIQAFVAFCRECSVPTFMASGGFMQLAEPIRRKVGFDGARANTLDVENGLLTGKLAGAIVDAQAKRDFLVETCARLGIAPEETAAVGDGANDIPMLNAAGVAVGYLPKPALLTHLDAQNAAGNHAFLAPLLFGRDMSLTRGRTTRT